MSTSNSEADSTPRCDVCNAVDETVEWCGNCGRCVQHCQHYDGCEDYAAFVQTGELPVSTNPEPMGWGCLVLCLLAAAPWILIVAFIMLAVIL